MSIGFGLIGASNIASSQMIGAIRQQGGCDVVSVLSSDLSRAKAYAETNAIPHATDSLQALLDNPDVDAVYVSTTNELHHSQVLAAAKASKHVLCEKPLAMSLDDAKEMIQACKDADVVMATNHHLRNAVAHRTLRQLIEEGVIGKPLAARVFHAVYLPEHLQGWRLTKKGAGGGVVMDITVHDIDTLRFILQANPVEVISMSQYSGMANPELEDGTMSIFKFDNNVQAQVHDAFTIKHAGNGLEVHGTEGSLIARNVMQQMPGGEIILRNANEERAIEMQHENLYDVGTRKFVEAIRGEGEPAATGGDGLYSLAAALACLESEETGRRVKIRV